jgi:hypothetical protein
MFANKLRPAHIWIRGVLRLNSDEKITCTVRRDFTIHPVDGERPDLFWHR